MARAQLLTATPQHVGEDFQIFWTAGLRLRVGANPYVPVYKTLGFVYPPFALLPFEALSLLPLHTAYLLWLGVCALCITAMVWLGAWHGVTVKWVAVVFVVVLMNGYTQRNAWYGQLGIPLVALVVVDMLGVRGRRGAGILTGIAAGLKFTPAIMIIYFLARRQWRAALTMGISFLSSVLVGVVASPHWSQVYWSNLLLHRRLGTGVPKAYGNSGNQGMTNAVIMLTGHVSPSAIAMGKWAAIVMGAFAVLAGARTAMLDRTWLSIGLLGIASCMVTTSTWDHHYAWFIVLPFAVACGEMRQLKVATGVLLIWTLWSYPRSWLKFARTQLVVMSNWQVAQAVATPILAALFCIACLVELVILSRSA